jgi:hypothetical protein
VTQDPPEAAKGSGELPGLDTSTANAARMWTYWIGGTDNFRTDREAGYAPPKLGLDGARGRPDSKCPAVARTALAMHAVLLTLASQPDGPGAQDAKGGSGKSQRRAAGGLT